MAAILSRPQCVNTLRPHLDGRHFADNIFKWIFAKKYVCILIEISLKIVPNGPIDNKSTLDNGLVPNRRQPLA